jgi:hypothetical protein
MDDEQIERYSMGCLTAEEEALCEEHLLVCESCQVRVTTSDEYVSAMRTASGQIRRRPREHKWPALFLARLMPLSAAAVIATGLTVVGVRLTERAGEGAPAIVALEATRGSVIGTHAPAGRRLDLAGMPARAHHEVSVVDGTGSVVWRGKSETRDGKAVAAVPRMNAGTYFVRLYDSGRLLREYGLEVAPR